jgi:protein-L-isoaspartate(D-aspartate) O-methyltransferase
MPASVDTPRPRRWRSWALGLLCMHATACTTQAAASEDDHAARRAHMVERQLAGRGIDDPRVLAAMGRIPRERFVTRTLAAQAYLDQPLPIGHEQTISQPYVVALMTQLARVGPGDRVLEIGTGSGYQTAVLAELAAEVYSIEIVTPLATRAALLLRRLGYSNFAVRSGDGYGGWPEHAPFDAIVVTAAPERVPAPLLEQLRAGGRLVIPVGPVDALQELRVIHKRADGSLDEQVVTPVRFVPLTGDAANRDRSGR